MASFIVFCFRNKDEDLFCIKQKTSQKFWKVFEVPGGFEPPYTVLQTAD